MDDGILQIKDLKTYIYTSHGVVKAIDGISFDIKRGEAFGLVGESGSGKTMTALSILRILPRPARIVGGRILFGGADILKMDEAAMRSIRGSSISMVFQEPASALDPVFTIGDQITEAVLAHQNLEERRKAKESALEYLKKVHIPEPMKVFGDYPHELSGGMKQRVMIAMALVNSPELIILDEPTTALDVTIQAQILDLLDEVIENQNLSILFISHDFGIIRRMCKRVAVMYKGNIVEMNDVDEIFNNPKAHYTVTLLESVKALV